MLNWFISTSALIAVVLLLRRLLRDKIDPRLTYVLWLLAALRVCIPVSLFTAPVSVSGLVEDSGLAGAVEEVREVVSPKQTMTFSVDPASGTTLEEYAQSWSDAGLKVYDAQYYTEEEIAAARQDNPAFYRNTDNLPVRLTVEKLVGGRNFWTWVYLTGVWVTLIVLGWTNRGFHKRAKRFRRPYEGELPVPCPLKVYELADFPSPCLYTTGFRPAIYLNRAAVESQHLDHVLTHELTHYRHKDHWWADVRLLCLCIQWFNPLVWLAAYLSRQDCELACDASVIERLGEDQRLSYGKTLVDMIASTRSPGAFLRPATTITGGKKSIAQRIQLIVKRPKMTAATLIAVLLIAALAVGCTFGGAEEERGAALEEYFGSTYAMAGHTDEALVGPIAISYSPTQGSIGELTITENFFGCFDEEGLDWGENVTDPVYAMLDFDPSAYGQSDRFYPALDDFFGRYESITVYEIENASKPLHLLILDGELWLAIHVGDVNCYILRLEEYAAASESKAPESTTQLPVTATPAELARSVYAAIVGEHNSRDFYVEATDGVEGEDGHTATLHITSANDSLVDYVGRGFPSFEWAYAGEEGSGAGSSLTLTSTDGEIWLRCWVDSDRVRLHVNGQDYFLTAVRPQSHTEDATLYSRLLLLTEDTPWEENTIDPAELAQSVYAAIVGDRNNLDSRDFYMVIYGDTNGGAIPTRVHITAENDWNLPNSVNGFDWAYADDPCSCAAPVTVTLTSADGETWLSCSEGCDRVILHVDGQNYHLSGLARGWEGANALLSTSLLRAADDALLDQAYSIVIDGDLADYETVVEKYARQFAANLSALPDWAASKPEGVVYRTSGAEQAYFGEGVENFCGYFGLYFSPEMGMSDWQAGSGMDQETEGEYAGWWKWGIGADFARNEDGDWVCTGLYTGGAGLTYPTPLKEATVEELVYYFYHTWGNNHDYLIPYYICQKPVTELDALRRALDTQENPAALCLALGTFLRDYGELSDILLPYDVLSIGLDSQYSAWLTVGYTNVGIPE